MKSRDILPLEDRSLKVLSEYGMNRLLMKYSEALTAAEQEFIDFMYHINNISQEHKLLCENYSELAFENVFINEDYVGLNNSTIYKDYLILSVDEYMRSQGIKPVFVTEDGKNIYEGENCWKVGVDEERKLPFISHITAGDLTDASKVRYFSNEYNARNYYSELAKQSLRANTGKFKVGDRVRLTRKCKSYEGDWDGIWAFADAYVGGNYTILSSDNQYGYQLDIKLWFPEFVLEKVITKYLADEFQVLKLEPYEDELPTSPKGKLFDSLEEANAYHESLKPNTYTVELPEGYEVVREYIVIADWEPNTVDGILLKVKRIKS